MKEISRSFTTLAHFEKLICVKVSTNEVVSIILSEFFHDFNTNFATNCKIQRYICPLSSSQIIARISMYFKGRVQLLSNCESYYKVWKLRSGADARYIISVK